LSPVTKVSAGDWARSLAAQLLADALPQRWNHVQGVGAKAESTASLVGPGDAPLLVTAAWLHDIGYAPPVVSTGLHSLDGARYLRDVAGADPRLCALVAHHSYARVEASNRGLLRSLLDEFPEEDSLISQVLAFCDMTTTPNGKSCDVRVRLAEILGRYGDSHVVAVSIKEVSPLIIRTVEYVEGLLDTS
jgi:hypothetical protein